MPKYDTVCRENIETKDYFSLFILAYFQKSAKLITIEKCCITQFFLYFHAVDCKVIALEA